MSKFTPGPWRVQNWACPDTGDAIVVDAGNNVVALAECAANVRLIAAAPELLHCLKVILDHADGDERLEVSLHLDIARQIVAKAEGSEPAQQPKPRS